MIKDKTYSTSIMSDLLLSNQIYSNKTNNNALSLSSSIQDKNQFNNFLIKVNQRHSFSNKELNIPDNPLPFVKLKPKK